MVYGGGLYGLGLRWWCRFLMVMVCENKGNGVVGGASVPRDSGESGIAWGCRPV